MKLSICIPTYNRFEFLKWTLARLEKDFPQAEIIVSDNASTDETSTLQSDPRITYIRQPSNIGAFDNMHAVLTVARGEYAIYCADDDYPLREEVERIIEYLDAHPEVIGYCAPCDLWNEIENKTFWNAFEVPKPITFDRTHGIELFNFIIERHVWPEHFVYRTPVPLKPRTRAYWAFSDIPDLLERGAIHFDGRPFYRFLVTHPVGERVQLGNQQCLTDFDEYRAGLELLAYGLFGAPLPYTARRRIQEMIQFFICARLDLAAIMYERQGQNVNAQMLRKRLAIASPLRDEPEKAAA